MSAPLHQRLIFDTAKGQVMDQSRRYLLMRADVLMGMFDLLPENIRSQAYEAIEKSVAHFGSDSVRAYAAQPRVSQAQLLFTMQEAAASLGWGHWQLTRKPAALELTVNNSPFATSSKQKNGCLCHPITGMLKGLANNVWSKEIHAREISCASYTGGITCHFEAYPV
jgi:uncharacterized protein